MGNLQEDMNALGTADKQVASNAANYTPKAKSWYDPKLMPKVGVYEPKSEGTGGNPAPTSTTGAAKGTAATGGTATADTATADTATDNTAAADTATDTTASDTASDTAAEGTEAAADTAADTTETTPTETAPAATDETAAGYGKRGIERVGDVNPSQSLSPNQSHGIVAPEGQPTSDVAQRLDKLQKAADREARQDERIENRQANKEARIENREANKEARIETREADRDQRIENREANRDQRAENREQRVADRADRIEDRRGTDASERYLDRVANRQQNMEDFKRETKDDFKTMFDFRPSNRSYSASITNRMNSIRSKRKPAITVPSAEPTENKVEQ